MRRWLYQWMMRYSYSSELGAATAYQGHIESLAGYPDEAAMVARIRDEELEHRAELARMMDEDGIAPFAPFEWGLWAIGAAVAVGCHMWPRWASAVGAAAFELNAVFEFSRLETLAGALGDEERRAAFERMAAQEDAHRAWFAGAATGRATT